MTSPSLARIAARAAEAKRYLDSREAWHERQTSRRTHNISAMYGGHKARAHSDLRRLSIKCSACANKPTCQQRRGSAACRSWWYAHLPPEMAERLTA
jgi:hypothetical protein